MNQGGFFALDPVQSSGGRFGRRYNDAFGAFSNVVDNLKDRYSPMDVDAAQYAALNQAKTDANAIYRKAREKLPTIRGGLTGSKKGQWSAGTASTATLIAILTAVFQQAKSSWDKAQQNEDAQWGQLTVTVLAGVCYSLQWVAWWRHSVNTREEAQYAEANSTEDTSMELMLEFLDAARDLNESITKTPDSHDAQWNNIRRIHNAYQKMPESQQMRLGELEDIKELYLLKIRESLLLNDGRKLLYGRPAIRYGNNELIVIYDRLRILCSAYMMYREKISSDVLASRSSVGSVASSATVNSVDISHLDFVQLKSIAEKAIDAAHGDWSALPPRIGYEFDDDTYKHDPRDLLLDNASIVKLWITAEWMRLEGYIKELPAITIGDGLKLFKSDLFDEGVEKRSRQLHRQGTLMIEIE